jgi:hypothetical protein
MTSSPKYGDILVRETEFKRMASMCLNVVKIIKKRFGNTIPTGAQEFYPNHHSTTSAKDWHPRKAHMFILCTNFTT